MESSGGTGESSEDTWVFSYGSNHPLQLSQRLEAPITSIWERSLAAIIHNYTRAFSGSSKKWNNGSVATIVPKEGSFVEGIAVRLNPEEISKLDGFEGHPTNYLRTQAQFDVFGEDGKCKLIEGEIYIKNDNSQFFNPDASYLEACSKTQRAYRELRGMPDHSISINILKASDLSLVSTKDFSFA